MLRSPAPPIMESSRWRPSIEEAPNCPRCASSNTKFCYFNNYSLSQPRYFCKSCRRYWTKGGSQRNVPVGGGCRKARRARASSRPTPPQQSTAPVSEDRDDDPHNHETHGCDIDMALVFANFLNQNATTASHQHLDDEANSMTSNATTHSDPHVVVGGRIPEEELSGIDQAEGLLGGDELAAQDVFWSDATTSSSFPWQLPLMPSRQELELEYSVALGLPFHEDAQFPITSSINSTSDDWSWSSLI